jgi:hypothetical protein
VRKFKTGFSKHTILPSLGLVILAVALTMCFNITSVDQPESAMAGEQITITIHAEILDDPNSDGISVSGSEFVLGLLVPKSWKIDGNTSISISSTPFSTTLSLMPKGEIETNEGIPWTDALEKRVGFGENYGDAEWVMFKATETYNPKPEDLPLIGTIEIVTTVGPENMIAQLGYFIGDNEYGMWDFNKNFSFFFTGCMEITDGEGAIKNLCGPAPEAGTAQVIPASFSWDDILTITFDATKGENDGPTDLAGASEVFLCATAHYDGGSKEICNATEKTTLKVIGEDKWTIGIWPSNYFLLPVNKEITSITYSFQNASGTIDVNNPIAGADFELIADCN